MYFGFHASAGGKIENLPLITQKMGGECFQFFSRNPYGGKVTPLDKEKVKKFKENCHLTKIENYYIHAPYFINLASEDNRIFHGSVKAIKDELERAEILGAKYLITHVGSAKDYKITDGDLFQNSDYSEDQLPDSLKTICQQRNFSGKAYERVNKGLEAIIGQTKKVSLLLEISAGAGAILGSSLEEIAFWLQKFPALGGFCLDTAHGFASGYDFREEKARLDFLQKLEKEIGQNNLKLIHLNDSKTEINSRSDRHAHLGQGKIGQEALLALVKYFWKNKYSSDIILETPTPEGLVVDLRILKEFRQKILEV